MRISSCRPLIFLLAVSLGAAEPAPPPEIGLREAVLTALRQNAALRVQQHEVSLREGVAQQASGLFDWNLLAGVTQERIRTPVGGSVVSGEDRVVYSVGAAKVLRNGLVIEPVASVASSEGFNPPSPAAGFSDLSLRIVAPLLRGRGRDSTGAAEAAARGDITVAMLLYRHALASQAFATTTAYWSARAAVEALAVQRDVELRAAHLLEAMKGLVEARIYPPIYQIQAEANLSEKTTVRRAAELREITARLELARALGLAPEQMVAAPHAGDAFPIAAGAPGSPTDAEAGRAAVLTALGARADYRAIRESAEPLEILARAAEIDRLPRLDLAIVAGYRGHQSGSSLVRPLGGDLTGGNSSVGLSLDWPMRNNYQLGLVRERRAAVNQAEAQAAALAADISSEVLTALAEVRIRAETVAAAATTVETARRALEGQQQQLRNGESTVLDVIDIENLSSSARLSLIEAQAGYAIAVARLRYSMGTIFTPGDADQDFGLQDLTLSPLP